MTRPGPGYVVRYIRKDRWTGVETCQHGRIWRTRAEAEAAASKSDAITEIHTVSTAWADEAEARAAESYLPGSIAA